MSYGILKYGSRELRKKCSRIEKVTGEIRQLAADMLDTMHKNNGLGLAAQQVGRTEALCVVDIPRDSVNSPSACAEGVSMPLIMINPEIVACEGTQIAQEGCLSFPEIYANIKRAETVEVSFTDLGGKGRVARVSGLPARAVQHEVDHLNAVLLVDRMSPVQKVAMAGKLKRLRNETRAGKEAEA
jgi:peptide deformylase